MSAPQVGIWQLEPELSLRYPDIGWVCRGPSGSIADKAGRPVRSTVPNLNALIVSASSGSSPATSNNSAFAQHSYDSLEGRLWSWTASLSGFVCHTLFPRTHLL